MKKLVLAVSLIAVASVAWAASVSATASIPAASVTNDPTSLDGGISAVASGLELKSVLVTAQQPFDGGVASQDLNIAYLKAWKLTTQGKFPDGGVGFAWSRFPIMDINLALPAGTGATHYEMANHSLSGYATAPSMGTNNRVTYSVQQIAQVDAGTPYVELIIEGRY